MVRPLHSIERRNSAYFFRIQIAVICSLILFILLFRYWPAHIGNEELLNDRYFEEKLQAQEFIITHLPASVERIAPLIPRPDVTIPPDEVVDVEFDLEISGLAGDSDFGPFPVESGQPELVEIPDHPPSVRRIVEPVTPVQARRDGVRVEIEVLYVVSEKGEVEEVSIEVMRIFNRATGRFETVSETGYGFREITLRAAEQWLFHPATYQGRPVRSISRHRFTFGSN